MSKELETAIRKINKINVWQFGVFEVSGRIQVVFKIDNRKMSNKRLAQEIELTTRKILSAIKDNPIAGYGVRIGAKIHNDATVFTAVFNEDMLKTDWKNKKLRLSEYAAEYNLVSALRF